MHLSHSKTPSGPHNLSASEWCQWCQTSTYHFMSKLLYHINDTVILMYTNENSSTTSYFFMRHLKYSILFPQIVLWGRSREELHHIIYNQPIRDWEGQPIHMYGEIVHSSRVSLHNSYTQVTSHYTMLRQAVEINHHSLSMSRLQYCYIDVLFMCLFMFLQETREHYLVLFSFHLLILSLDHSHHGFIYEVGSFTIGEIL